MGMYQYKGISLISKSYDSHYSTIAINKMSLHFVTYFGLMHVQFVNNIFYILPHENMLVIFTTCVYDDLLMTY